jgi:hypothetical protein
MTNTILVGKDSSTEFIPQHPLLNTIDRCLCRLVNDSKTKPEHIVQGMWFAAAIIEAMGPPMMIVKNPYSEP